MASRTAELLSTFEKYAEDGSPVELDNLFMDATMDIINYYLYGRNDLNYDIVGGRTNMKVNVERDGYVFHNIHHFVESLYITILDMAFSLLKHGFPLASTRLTGHKNGSNPHVIYSSDLLKTLSSMH